MGHEIELQDLGDGKWRGVYGDRSILLTEHEGKLETTLGELALWAGMDRKQGPSDLAKILRTSVIDGLIPNSEIGGAELVGLDFLKSLKTKGVGPGPTWKSEIPCKDWTLTRKAALLLMTRCRTPRAIELTRAMADVFEQWLDRRYHAADAGYADLTAELREALAEQGRILAVQASEIRSLRQENAEIRQILAANTSPHGLVGNKKAREILARILLLTSLVAPREIDEKAWRKARKEYENRVRSAADWPQRGAVAEMLATGEPRAWICLAQIEREIIKVTKGRTAQRRVREAMRRAAQEKQQMAFADMLRNN